MIDKITQNFHMLENECLERFSPQNIVFVDSIVALAAAFTSFVINFGLAIVLLFECICYIVLYPMYR